MTRNASHPYTVAIIGGGFSGSIVAAQLLRRSSRPISIVVIERSHSRGLGVAYSTPHGAHLLNVPAAKMSAFPSDPDHFLRWARNHFEPETGPERFVPRRIYGTYIDAIVRESQKTSGNQLHWIDDESVSVVLDRSSAVVNLRSGRNITADRVVLALGNFRPSDPALPGRTAADSRYISYSWDPSALSNIKPLKSVLLVGSGLTSVDLALALRACQFTGVIHVISRRGLLPRPHRSTTAWPAFWNAQSPRTIRGVVRMVRCEAKEAKKKGVGWRAVVDSLRPVTHEIWASLPLQEKRRFLRHVRPYWEVHRHRVAPEIGEFLGAQIADCHMQVHAGRIVNYRESADSVEIAYIARGSGKTANIRVDRVINCTGPETDCRRLEDPLLAALFAAGHARPDALQLGLDVASNGALLDASGVTSNLIFAIGPSRKGTLWETTAVPELRAQAAALVDELLPAILYPQPSQVAFDSAVAHEA